MRSFLCSVAILAALTFSVGVFGVLPVPSPRVCTEFYDSDLVAVVDVRSSRLEVRDDGSGEEIYRVNVREILRGDASDELEIRAGLHSARGSLEIGITSLLFAVQHKSEVDNKTAFFLYGGGYTGPLREADQRLSQIRLLLAETKETASVRGYVYPYPVPLPEKATFVALYQEQSYETSIDAEGWFHFELPPRTYDIVPKDDDSIMIYDQTYDYPKQLNVKAGQCYEVAFRGRY